MCAICITARRNTVVVIYLSSILFGVQVGWAVEQTLLQCESVATRDHFKQLLVLTSIPAGLIYAKLLSCSILSSMCLKMVITTIWITLGELYLCATISETQVRMKNTSVELYVNYTSIVSFERESKAMNLLMNRQVGFILMPKRCYDCSFTTASISKL